ncbi:LysR family transcriptional regulator [Bacillus cereus]|uniref:HTH-type transcriptional regulator CzcR n=1 Tax=Bacillus cereus TaxID=1396 RepID=A0A2C1MRD7_BACCE|nr:LysR family transcriptional regulator [Bacillus cereus]PFQ40479.1 LysR family transcriptional regulator [Bacillus cereus]PGU13268.1 LysR family transcriptional regulator [Bacillus cereus]
MDIRQLKYFLMIAEEGQITSAAKKLQMAQPPLSQQLKLLEEELGVKLVERGARSIRLTDAGEILHRRAQQIVDLTDSTSREVSDFAKGLKGTLAIGTVSSSGATLLKDRLSEFHKAYTGIKFEIHEGNTFRVIELLQSGVIELGIVRTPFHNAGMGYKCAEKEPMIAVMTPELDWCNGRDAIQIEELHERPLVIYRRFEQLIRETCQKAGFETNLICKNDDARTTLLWANAGLGIGIIPKSAFELANHSSLIYKEIDSPSLQTSIAAIWIKDRYMSSLARKFLENFSKE